MIYIDNSATTKQYPQVTETMVKYMEEYFGNPSSMYQLGLDSEKAVKHARKQVEEAMGAGNGTLIFTSGGTEADNTAIFGAARALRRRGNRIITSAVEHPAVLECAITAAPDPIRGQVVKATVVLTKGYTPSPELTKELQNHVKHTTAPYKYPRIIEYVDELPKTLGGKIKRAQIRKEDETAVKNS